MDRRKALIHCVVEYTLKTDNPADIYRHTRDLTKQTDLGGVLCTMQTHYIFQLESRERNAYNQFKLEMFSV